MAEANPHTGAAPTGAPQDQPQQVRHELIGGSNTFGDGSHFSIPLVLADLAAVKTESEIIVASASGFIEESLPETLLLPEAGHKMLHDEGGIRLPIEPIEFEGCFLLEVSKQVVLLKDRSTSRWRSGVLEALVKFCLPHRFIEAAPLTCPVLPGVKPTKKLDVIRFVNRLKPCLPE